MAGPTCIQACPLTVCNLRCTDRADIPAHRTPLNSARLLCDGPRDMTSACTAPVSVGHYLITPLTRVTDQGDYAASVSLRRGSYDRVYRFFPALPAPKALCLSRWPRPAPC